MCKDAGEKGGAWAATTPRNRRRLSYPNRAAGLRVARRRKQDRQVRRLVRGLPRPRDEPPPECGPSSVSRLRLILTGSRDSDRGMATWDLRAWVTSGDDRRTFWTGNRKYFGNPDNPQVGADQRPLSNGSHVVLNWGYGGCRTVKWNECQLTRTGSPPGPTAGPSST